MSRLREKSFSRNAEQARSPSLISLLLSGRRGIRTYIFDIGVHGHSTVNKYGCAYLRICVFDFSATGILQYKTI